MSRKAKKRLLYKIKYTFIKIPEPKIKEKKFHSILNVILNDLPKLSKNLKRFRQIILKEKVKLREDNNIFGIYVHKIKIF